MAEVGECETRFGEACAAAARVAVGVLEPGAVGVGGCAPRVGASAEVDGVHHLEGEFDVWCV